MNIRAATAWARRNAIALLALFVALGGTGYAAVAINGKQLKNGTVTGKKLKRDTVTGREGKESRLGTVPSTVRASPAGKADTPSTARTADAATDAGTLDGFDSAAFTRGACGTNNGAIHGYARIDASAGLSRTFTHTGAQSAQHFGG